MAAERRSLVDAESDELLSPGRRIDRNQETRSCWNNGRLFKIVAGVACAGWIFFIVTLIAFLSVSSKTSNEEQTNVASVTIEKSAQSDKLRGGSQSWGSTHTWDNDNSNPNANSKHKSSRAARQVISNAQLAATRGWEFDWEEAIMKGPMNTLPGTTGQGIPGHFKKWLESTGVKIDDDAQTSYGAANAVKAMENGNCGGWDPHASAFRKPECIDELNFQMDSMTPQPDPAQIDIVTPSIRNLDFLNDWREFFEGFHVIIIQDGDQDKVLKIPSWVDYELHKRVDIVRALGDDAWIISQKDASIRNYGFLVSKKRYIYTIDDDCRPAHDKNGRKINPIALHWRNLKTPSTPYMFNTLYDPYVPGSDFVRGYPYSLRKGVHTGVSHGLWMNNPDYDAPTQLLKVKERVKHMYNTAVTVPAGIFFPLCSMNVAFDRKLIGPAVMQGLMGVGQPWGRYDDMFSGWAAKAVADHLGVGVKSGAPYIKHNKASNPFTNLRKEYKGLWWQELVLRFFMTKVKFSAKATTPSLCYLELAKQIRVHLGPTHDYFKRLAKAMELWTKYWDMAAAGEIQFKASRHSSKDVS